MNPTRIIRLKVEKLHKEEDNHNTVVVDHTLPVPHRAFRDLFAEHYQDIRVLCDGFPRRGLAMVVMGGRGIAARACLAAKEGCINSVVIGRHGLADVYLPGDGSLSLRHLLVILYPLAEGNEVRFRLMDLRTATGFSGEHDQQLEAVEADGPVFVRFGQYTLFCIPTGDDLQWADTAEAGWDRFPEQIYLEQQDTEHARWWSRKIYDHQAHHRDDARTPISTLVHTLPGPKLTNRLLVDADEQPLGVLTVKSEEGTCRLVVGPRALRQGILVGRSDRCDSGGIDAFSNESISRVHMVLLKIATRIYAVDTASTNGVWAGDKEVRLIPLGSHERFSLGAGQARLVWTNSARVTEDHD